MILLFYCTNCQGRLLPMYCGTAVPPVGLLLLKNLSTVKQIKLIYLYVYNTKFFQVYTVPRDPQLLLARLASLASVLIYYCSPSKPKRHKPSREQLNHYIVIMSIKPTVLA